MNRIILIGNGFDKAHGLKTGYADFIHWCQDKWTDEIVWNRGASTVLYNCHALQDGAGQRQWIDQLIDWRYSLALPDPKRRVSFDDIVQFSENYPGIVTLELSHLMSAIYSEIEEKGWADIEQIYYALLKRALTSEDRTLNPVSLNEQLDALKQALINYLKYVSTSIDDELAIPNLKKLMFGPIEEHDLSIPSKEIFYDHLYQNSRLDTVSLAAQYSLLGIHPGMKVSKLEHLKQEGHFDHKLYDYLDLFAYPSDFMILDFNYTHTIELYLDSDLHDKINHIHGDLSRPESVIFGYGDELDSSYQKILDLNDNRYLSNMKTSYYLESSNYRKMLSFINSDKYQIYILGHSCGNSDRTLLNTLFEHENCVSIKPFYYKSANTKDDYINIIQNISRNFTDMKLMRNRVVNKEFCQPLPQK